MENYEQERRKIVAENIKKLIKEKGITQKQLAKEIGMSQNIITEYVKLRSFPPGGVLQKIADYFGVKKSDIDTTWKKDVNSEYTPYINVTIETMKKLDEPRQKIVLKTANEQLEEQEKEMKAKESIPLHKDEDTLYSYIDEAAAWQGEDLSEEDREAIMIALKDHLEKKAKEED